jgi:hypothetical protein
MKKVMIFAIVAAFAVAGCKAKAPKGEAVQKQVSSAHVQSAPTSAKK